MRTALAARERKERKALGAKSVLGDLCTLSRPILHRARRSPSPLAPQREGTNGPPTVAISAPEPVLVGRGVLTAPPRSNGLRMVGGGLRTARPTHRRFIDREKPKAASTTLATVHTTQKTGNSLEMSRLSLKSTLQTPYPAAKGALPGWKRCLTFSEKVANLFGKAALPFRQGCHTLWDRARQPRRPGALTSTSWPGTTARTGLNYVPEVTWQKGLGHRLDFYRAGNK